MAEQLGEFTDRSLQMNSLTRVHALIIVIIPACLHAQIAQKWRPLASTLKDAQSRARLSAVFRHVGQVNTEKSECSRETSRHRILAAVKWGVHRATLQLHDEIVTGVYAER